MGSASMSARISNVLPGLAPSSMARTPVPPIPSWTASPRAHALHQRRGCPHLVQGQLGVLMQRPAQRDHARLQRIDVVAEVEERRHCRLPHLYAGGRAPGCATRPQPGAELQHARDCDRPITAG